MRLIILFAGLFWVGSILLLAELRLFNRRPLADRLMPYTPGGMGKRATAGLLSVGSFRDVVAPLSSRIGERLSQLAGVSEELAVRLERIHSPLTASEYRVRQVGWSVALLGASISVSIALTPPPGVIALALIGSPALSFLIGEHLIAKDSQKWQRRVFLELPVVAEQLAMLLGSGYSLGGALSRLADRGDGSVAQDLRRVRRRTRQGLTDVQALREWSRLVNVPAVDRLVSVLALNSDATDLGRLVSDEARSIRRDVQRELIETIERRTQQVWIPVTVATLIPGVMLMLVPFVDALSVFSGS